MIHSTLLLSQHYRNLQPEPVGVTPTTVHQRALYNDRTFFPAFERDLEQAKEEVIICSPFVTKFRSEHFRRTLKLLQRRNIAVFIITRPLVEHDFMMRNEARVALQEYEQFGAFISFVPGNIHEKVAIIDRTILWEGSLNILSQRNSREMMRRFSDTNMAKQTMEYLGINKWIAAGYRTKYERLYRSLIDGAAERSARARLVGLGMAAAVVAAVWLLSSLHGTIDVLRTVIQLLRLLNTPIR